MGGSFCFSFWRLLVFLIVKFVGVFFMSLGYIGVGGFYNISGIIGWVL